MTDQLEPDQDSRQPDSRETRTRILVIGGAIVVAILAIAGVAVAIGTAASRDSAGPTSSPTVSTTPSETPEPSASATKTPKPTPTKTSGPVNITDPGTVTTGLTAQIGNFASVKGQATGPGEIDGPSVRFDVTFTNDSSKSANLANTVVTVYYGADKTPALELHKPGGKALPSSVAAGKTATGTFIFTIPSDERANVRIEVDYSVKVKPLVFAGAVPE
jgi:hypothetical protein